MSIRPASPGHSNSAVTRLFSYFRNSHPPFPGGHYDLTPPCGGCPYGGFPNFGYRLDHKFHISCLELKAVHNLCLMYITGLQCSRAARFLLLRTLSFLYQQTRRDPFSFLVESSNGSLYVAASPEHSSQSQALPRCLNVIADRLSKNDRMESPLGDCEPESWEF